jgi:hypothetical protein
LRICSESRLQQRTRLTGASTLQQRFDLLHYLFRWYVRHAVTSSAFE